MTRYLSAEQIISANLRHGGEGAGLRDRNILEGAIGRAQQGVGDVEVHSTLWDKAAVLLHGIASTQAFLDGNKRTAWLTAEAFLNLNGQDIGDVSDVHAETFVRCVAAQLIDLETTAQWFTDAFQTARLADSPRLGPQEDDGAGVQLQGGTYRLVDLVDRWGRITNMHATDVTFLGPAILLPLGGNVTFDRCGWIAGGDVGPEAVTWEIPRDREAAVGAVGLLDSTFENCRFFVIGYAAHEDAIHKFFEGISV